MPARKKAATKRPATARKKMGGVAPAQANRARKSTGKSAGKAKSKPGSTARATSTKARKTAARAATQSSGARMEKTVANKKTATAKPEAKRPAATKKPPLRTSTATKGAPAHKRAPRPARPALEGFHEFEPYRRKRGEEYMSPAQVEHFRHILTTWRQQLMEEVDRTVHHMQDDAGNFPDPNDRATQEEEFALELRTRDRERKLIRKINESLAALESGDYGYCETCGVEIGIERLEARPTATLCIDCKTLDEIREKQRA